MLEWGSNQQIYGEGNNNRNPSANYLCEDKPEAESATQEELSRTVQLWSATPWSKFFFSSMLEEIVDIRNIQRAFKQVTANKGAGGMDDMQTDELRDYLHVN